MLRRTQLARCAAAGSVVVKVPARMGRLLLCCALWCQILLPVHVRRHSKAKVIRCSTIVELQLAQSLHQAA